MSKAVKFQYEKPDYKALLAEVLKRSSEAVVLLNADAEILFCSESIEASTGYTMEDLIGRSAFDFFHSSNLASVKLHYQYLIQQKGRASASVIQIRHQQGYMTWIDAEVQNLLHAEHVNAVLVLLKDSCDAGIHERKLVQAVMEAREQEREFLATELHDNINQVITATKLLVDSARISIDREELLSLSSTNLQLAIEEIRKLSHSMVSYDLKEFGLAFAITSFLETLSKCCTVIFEITLDEEAVAALSAGQQLQVYRIIQEASNNIVRHSGASFAEVQLTRQQELVSMVIRDNGKGFSIHGLKRGMGLYSITNRVKLLRGHFHLQSEEGAGTIIETHFPI